MENATRVQARLGAVDIMKFSECSVGEEVDRIINTLIHIEHLRELLPKPLFTNDSNEIKS